MAEKDATAEAPTESVSSLRSRFETLANLKPPTAHGSTAPSSPRSSKFLEAQNQPAASYGRASLDLPRPQSPWTTQARPDTPSDPSKRLPPQTPPSGTNSSPKRYGHARPMSMSVTSSPSLTPAVLVESPRSPPRGHLFTRNTSRSPERRSFLHFSSSPTAPRSFNSSRNPSRPSSPYNEDSRPLAARGKSTESLNSSKNGATRGPPPPVNRADKPKIPAKLAPPLQGPEADSASKRSSMVFGSNPRISPFSTPPGSEGSPSPERLQPAKGFETIGPRLAALSGTSNGLASRLDEEQATTRSSLPKDPRELGFSSRAAEPNEPRDPRLMGFSSGPDVFKEPNFRRRSAAPSPHSAIRSNTLPLRDPRSLGLSSEPPGIPPPRRSQDIQRPLIPASIPPRDARTLGFSNDTTQLPRKSGDGSRPYIPVLEKKPGILARPSRDPRSLGFASTAAASEFSSAEPPLPPRRVDSLPPPRPSDASKYSSSTNRNSMVSTSRPVDRSKIPSSNASTSLPEDSMTPASNFPPPPKRAGSIAEPKYDNIQRRESDLEDSDDAEDASTENFAARTDYPDTTQANRRPPFIASGVTGIPVKYETRIFDVCGRTVCTSGFMTRLWDLETGENIMSLTHGETVKALTVIFKPAAKLEDEGRRIWTGNNAGDLQEIDLQTQMTTATSSAHNRREILKLFRHKQELWSLDDEGKLFVWPADETGGPNLNYSHQSHKVQRGYTFGLVVGDHLWLATGKELHVYKPGSISGFQVLQKPLIQSGAGEITSGTFPGATTERVYFGYTDGKVAVYNTRDFSCIGVVKISDYKINSMVMTGSLLWAAYKTGKIYVYDTSITPWKVKKDWKAHEGPVIGMSLDVRGIWNLHRLQVTSLGQDNIVRSWDGMLEDDWIENEMHQRDTEYCSFREVRASIVTWNAGASTPYDIRNDFLRDAIHPEDPPDILVFGFQELVDLEDRTVTAKNILGFHKKKDPAKSEQHVSRVYREWRDYLNKSIHNYMDTSVFYTELNTSSLIGLFLCIFVRQDQRRSIKNVNAAEVKCGMKGRYGNKGALILRFTYDDSSLCFVNCHLAAGQTQTSHRNNDVATILEAEALPPETDLKVRSSTYVGGGDGTQILDHEICVLNGDLNYRIDAMPRNAVVDYIKRNELNKLLERDQIMLSRRRVSGFRLSAFAEAPITFAPTYKYDVGTDNYDTSEKKRSPAWCDRILYRGPGRIKQTEYRRHEVRVSDHRPVSGSFRMRIKTIDASKRAGVYESSMAKFTEVKRKMAADASIDYLVLYMGVDVQEARRLIAEG